MTEQQATEIKAVEPAARERSHGITHVREAEVWHLAAVVEDAFGEGETLARKVHDDTADAYLPTREGRTELDADEVRRRLAEALLCAQTADHYLRMLLDEIPSKDPWAQPSF